MGFLAPEADRRRAEQAPQNTSPPPAPTGGGFVAPQADRRAVESRSRAPAPTPAPVEPPRPTQPSNQIPARQANIRTPTREQGTLGDVGAAFVAILRRSAQGAGAMPMSGNVEDDNRTFRRAWDYLSGEGRRNTRGPGAGREFNFQIVHDIYDDPHWEGGPLSDAMNALPRPLRAWLDTEGRLARISVGQFLNADTDARAQIIHNNVPTAQFRRDEYGNLQVRLRPNEEWAFINAPGLSAEDALTTAQTLERYTPAARLAAAPRLLASRAAMGAAASAATEYGSQSADDLVGGPEGVDAGDVTAAGVYGAGGQLAFDTVAAGGQVAKRYARRLFGGGREAPLPNPGDAPANASETYGEGPPPRDFDADRAAIDARAEADLNRLTEEAYNVRVPRAANIFGNSQELNNATRLTPGQERVIEDHIRRVRRVEQERRAAHARLDNEQYGMELQPPALLHDRAREAMRDGKPVFVETPQGIRRVENVYDEGFIDETGQHIPSAGMVADMTEDGLLFSVPQRPSQPRPQAQPAPAAASAAQSSPKQRPVSASDIYAASNEFKLPVSRGEAAQDVAERTREYDMLNGALGPAAQRRAARFQDDRAAAVERAGRNIATRNQEPLTQNVEDAGQVVQNQVRERFATLTQEENQAYHEAMTALAEVPVGATAGRGMLSSVERRLRYGGEPLGEELESLIPITGFDPDIIRRATKSRPGDALRMITGLQDEIVSRAAMRRGNDVRFSHVERVRQRLLEMQQDAIAAKDPDGYAMDLIVQGFDEWLGPALSQPPQIRVASPGAAFDYSEQKQLRQQAEAAITRARALHAEKQRLFTRQGAGDLAGRTMEQIRALDTTGEQIINQILGAGRIPPSQARATVQRIVDIGNRTTASGALAARGETTTASRRFEGGTAHPSPEIQAIREALWMRILEPMRKRGQGNQAPMQTVVNNLDTALNGPGRAVTRAMFVDSEVKTMERLLAAMRYQVPTTGSRPTGVTAARLIGNAADGVSKFVGGMPGMVLRGLVGIVAPGVREASGELAATRAFSRPALENGLPATQSGVAYGQTVRDNRDSGAGADVPLERPPPSRASQAYEAAIDMSRPIISADNGEFSTERTITVEIDGQYYNIPTIVNGQQLSVSAALSAWEEGRNPEVGRFGTEAEAVSAAQRRSQEIGRRRGAEAGVH